MIEQPESSNNFLWDLSLTNQTQLFFIIVKQTVSPYNHTESHNTQ